MVTIAVRVRPPPAEAGATISPTSASLRSTVPSNGARLRVLEIDAGELDLSVRRVELGSRHAHFRLGVLEVGVGIEPLGAQRLGPLEIALRLEKLGLDLRRARLRARELRFEVAALDARDHIADLDVRALGDPQELEPPRDLRRDRGLGARDRMSTRLNSSHVS